MQVQCDKVADLPGMSMSGLPRRHGARVGDDAHRRAQELSPSTSSSESMLSPMMNVSKCGRIRERSGVAAHPSSLYDCAMRRREPTIAGSGVLFQVTQ